MIWGLRIGRGGVNKEWNFVHFECIRLRQAMWKRQLPDLGMSPRWRSVVIREEMMLNPDGTVSHKSRIVECWEEKWPGRGISYRSGKDREGQEKNLKFLSEDVIRPFLRWKGRGQVRRLRGLMLLLWCRGSRSIWGKYHWQICPFDTFSEQVLCSRLCQDVGEQNECGPWLRELYSLVEEMGVNSMYK